MLCLRIVIPLSLLSSLASASAVAELTPRACVISPTSASCEAELERAFERARNAEINASIAAVDAARNWLAMSLTHCKTQDSTTPRCLAERARELALAVTHCKTPDSTTPRCEAERARDFAAARNAEINASIAAVNAERARALAQSLTHCDSPTSTTPRCMAERARETAAANNSSITTASACQPYNWLTAGCDAKTVASVRSGEIVTGSACQPYNWLTSGCGAKRPSELAQSLTHCKTADSTTPRCEAERAREFAAARNAEIDASIAAVEAERARAFAAARNAEINASIAAVSAVRVREMARLLTHCKSDDSTTPRCEAERAREFAAARNAEIDASIAAVNAERSRAFAAARNAEANASIAAVEAERTRAFAAARNAEINASIAASEAQRALRQAQTATTPSSLETGAISLPEHLDTAPAVKRETGYAEPCREAGRIMSPLQFTDGSTQIEQDMMPELDRIAMMAKSCPAIRIEIHGHSDNSASTKVNRYLAERRALAAVAYLAGLGIDRNRLAAVGHGETQPVASNRTAADRARNRRIEIKIHDPAVEAAAHRVMWDLAELLDPTYVPPLARLSP